jgi:hypothetical protein
LGGFIDAFGCKLLAFVNFYNFCFNKFDGFLFSLDYMRYIPDSEKGGFHFLCFHNTTAGHELELAHGLSCSEYKRYVTPS